MILRALKSYVVDLAPAFAHCGKHAVGNLNRRRLDWIFCITDMKYEEGLREPPFWLLVRMARLYGVTTDFLLIGAKGENQEIPITNLVG